MSLIINGTTIPSSGNVTFDGHNVEKIICDGVTVWEKITNVKIPFGTDKWIGTIEQPFYHDNVDPDDPDSEVVLKRNCSYGITGSSVYIHAQDNGGKHGWVSAYYTTPIDVTAFKYIKIKCTITSAWGITHSTMGFGLSSTTSNRPAVFQSLGASVCSNKEFVMDISRLQGNYYPGIYAFAPGLEQGIADGVAVTITLTSIEFTSA